MSNLVQENSLRDRVQLTRLEEEIFNSLFKESCTSRVTRYQACLSLELENGSFLHNSLVEFMVLNRRFLTVLELIHSCLMLNLLRLHVVPSVYEKVYSMQLTYVPSLSRYKLPGQVCLS